MEFIKYDEAKVRALLRDFLAACDKHLPKKTDKLEASKDAMCAVEAIARTHKIIVGKLKNDFGLEIKLVTEEEAKRIGSLPKSLPPLPGRRSGWTDQEQKDNAAIRAQTQKQKGGKAT